MGPRLALRQGWCHSAVLEGGLQRGDKKGESLIKIKALWLTQSLSALQTAASWSLRRKVFSPNNQVSQSFCGLWKNAGADSSLNFPSPLRRSKTDTEPNRENALRLSVATCTGVKTVSERQEALKCLMLCSGNNLANTFLETGKKTTSALSTTLSSS